MKALRVSHHLLLCATPTKAKCCDPTIGAASWAALKQGVKALGLVLNGCKLRLAFLSEKELVNPLSNCLGSAVCVVSNGHP